MPAPYRNVTAFLVVLIIERPSDESRRIEKPFEKVRRDLEDTGLLIARVFEKTGLLVTPPSQRNRARKRETVGDEATRKVEGKGVKCE